MLTKAEIRDHYKRAEIKDTIIRVSTDGEYSRAGCKHTPKAYRDRETGELKDSMDWYNFVFSGRTEDKKINLSNNKDYIRAVTECRTLYWTLNIFENGIYDIDHRGMKKTDRTDIAESSTTGYTFGIDIDREHGTDIHNPEVKKAVEDMASFYISKLREHVPNSVYCLYSGGGIYVLVHHHVFNQYFERFKVKADFPVMYATLLDAFNCIIGDWRVEFFKLHPEHVGKVKPDALNNSQRVFKTIYSIHKTLDYAVVPLNVDNVIIDFEKATLPISEEVINEGDSWYSQSDECGDFLNGVMKPYLEKSYEREKKRTRTGNGECVISSVPINEIEKWAPCMRNLYEMPECGEGRTRALAILCSFWGQIGIEEDYARFLFNEVSERWGAIQSNIFESYFQSMKVPSCARLISDDNRGFPKGVSIKSLNVCQPDSRCVSVPSPRYYTDRVANKLRLLAPIPDKKPVKKSKNTENIDNEIPVF